MVMEKLEFRSNLAKGKITDYMTIWNKHLEGKKFFVGDKMTIADITIAGAVFPKPKIPHWILNRSACGI